MSGRVTVRLDEETAEDLTFLVDVYGSSSAAIRDLIQREALRLSRQHIKADRRRQARSLTG